MDKNITVIILAAGMGTRMNSSKPKAMHLLGNAPMIDHLLYVAKQLSPSQIISVIGEEMVDMNSHISTECDVVFQRHKQGSAHAVFMAKYAHKAQSGVTLVLYADTPLVKLDTLKELTDSILNGSSDLSILAFEEHQENSYGKLVINKAGFVTNIVEYADATPAERKIKLCNSGVMAIRSDKVWHLLNQIDKNNAKQEYYLTDAIDVANKEQLKCSYILDATENLLGANSKSDLARLEQSFQRQKRQEFIHAGVQLLDANTTYFSFDTKIGRDVVIYPNVHIFSKTEIKDNVTIFPFSVIEGATVGINCKIGPFARIRPHSVLEGNNNIGNFVEIKKANIGQGTKINHLSYIGDADIGDKTNIGAGVITCNYDGTHKYKTTIGHNCFIGANSSLIAPVTINNGATVGSGSTITSDVAENTLAIAREKQINIANWHKKLKK